MLYDILCCYQPEWVVCFENRYQCTLHSPHNHFCLRQETAGSSVPPLCLAVESQVNERVDTELPSNSQTLQRGIL